MSNNQLIDKIKIGNIEFEAYIIVDENNLEAFAIYCQKADTPLILFKQISSDYKVEIEINQKQVEVLQQLKSKNPTQRREHFMLFREFVLTAEQKAKEIVFHDTKLNYFTDVQLIKSIERAYLLD